MELVACQHIVGRYVKKSVHENENRNVHVRIIPIKYMMVYMCT